MTVPILKIKVLPKPVIKGRMDVRFPANIQVEKFLKVDRANGTYTFDIDYTLLSAGPVNDATTAYIAVLDQAAGLYRVVSLASLLTSGLDADLQAIAALTGTGIPVRTADDTWAIINLGAGVADFLATPSSANLAAAVTDETGSGSLVFSQAPTLASPVVVNGDYYRAIRNSPVVGVDIIGFAAGTNILEVRGSESVKITDTTNAQIALFTASGGVQIGSPSGGDKGSGSLNATTYYVSGVAQAFPASGNIVGISDAQTLTGKTISGSDNTLSNIGNSSLTNSSITIAGHSVSLGGSQAIAVGDLSSISDGTIVSRIAGSSGAPAANSISSVLDKLLGTTQGSVIYRGAASWEALAPGASGNFLKTQGAASNPVWDSIPGGGDMLASNNLSDVASANTSADNIGAYRKGTILGAVSQSGGVPTGAIIEQGSNANGNYVKYADGTQLCWGALIRTGVAINNPGTTSGCHFENSAQTITFPAVFIAAPSFTHSENSGNLMWTWGSPPPTTTQGSLRLVSASLESSRNSHICWQASGRWF